MDAEPFGFLLRRLKDYLFARIIEDNFETAQHSHANVASQAVIHGRSFEEKIRRQVIERHFAELKLVQLSRPRVDAAAHALPGVVGC